MNRLSRMPIVVAAIAAAVLISCAGTRGADDEALADRAQSLTYVAIAVHGYVRFMNPPEGLSGAALIKEATADNLDLLKPLEGYFITARREGLLSSVLMCEMDKSRALRSPSSRMNLRLPSLSIWHRRTP